MRIDWTDPLGSLFPSDSPESTGPTATAGPVDQIETAGANFLDQIQQSAENLGGAASAALSQFQSELTSVAQDPQAFHQLLKNSLGPLYKEPLVEGLRNGALAGSFSWMPGLEYEDIPESIFEALTNTVKAPAQYAGDAFRTALSYIDGAVGFVSDKLLENQVKQEELLRNIFSTMDNRSEVSGFYGDPLSDAMSMSRRIDGALADLLAVPGALTHGAWKAGEEILVHGLQAVALKLQNRDVEATVKGLEAGFDLGQAVFDAAATILVGAAAAVQTLAGAADPGRKLTDDEIAGLRKVYGDSIDYDSVRVKENVGGVLGLSGRAFTVGNTIYIPEGEELTDSLIVHESGHVWQFQNGGLDYISDALIGRYLGGDGYNVAQAIVDGKSWAELNPEQQAELMEIAFAKGLFDVPTEDRGHLRLMVRVREPLEGEAEGANFDVVTVDQDDPNYQNLIDDGWVDATDEAYEASDEAQSGLGAP